MVTDNSSVKLVRSNDLTKLFQILLQTFEIQKKNDAESEFGI